MIDGPPRDASHRKPDPLRPGRAFPGSSFPPWVPPPSGSGGIQEIPPERLNKITRKVEPQQAQVGGQNSLLPVVYGTRMVGARITALAIRSGYLYLQLTWCHATIDSIEQIYINDVKVTDWPGVIRLTHYGVVNIPNATTLEQTIHSLGVDGGIDPTLRTILGVGYVDTMPGVTYTVAKISQESGTGFPRFMARMKGLRVRQTQAGARVFSATPAYIIADYIESATYGMRSTVDWATVATVAAENAALVGLTGHQEERRQLNVMLDSPQPKSDWLQNLCDYGGCWAVPEGTSYRLIADADGASVFAFDESNIIAGSLSIRKRGLLEVPTCAEIGFTNTTSEPWKDDKAYVYSPGAREGTVPRRWARVQRTGVNRYSEAYRYGVERINTGLLCDLTISWVATDIGLQILVGDLVTVTYAPRLSAKKVRIVRAEPIEPGRWGLVGVEHDPLKYSTEVVDGPSVDDTELPNPALPPTITGLAVSEEVYQRQGAGLWETRLRITWTDPSLTWELVKGVYVEVYAGQQLVAVNTVLRGTNQFVAAPVIEGTLYTAFAYVVSTIDIKSATAAAVSITPTGRVGSIPTDITNLVAIEVGGATRAQWTNGTDLDYAATELRYSSQFGAASDGASLRSQWASATVLERLAAPTSKIETAAIPPGNWRLYAKGLDSVRSATYPWGQESYTPDYVDFVVSSDAGSYVALEYAYTSPTLYKMVAGVGYWVTGYGETWSSLFSSTMSTYTNALATYHTTGLNGWITEAADHGASVSGSWTATIDADALSGAYVAGIELSTGPESGKSITGATNATPIVITCTSHGYSEGDEVEQSGVLGNTAANGRFRVGNPAANTYELRDLLGYSVAGNGTYTSGGTAARWFWTNYGALTANGTARYSRVRVITDGGTIYARNIGVTRLEVIDTRPEGGLVQWNGGGGTGGPDPPAYMPTLPHPVFLSGAYSKAVSVTAIAIGSSAGYCNVENIELSGGLAIADVQQWAACFMGATTSYASASDNAAYTFGNGAADNAFSVGVWVKPKALGSAMALVSKGSTGATGEWKLSVNASGRPVFTLYDQSAASRIGVEGDFNLVVGVWTYIVGTYSGNESVTGLKLYAMGMPLPVNLQQGGSGYIAMEDTTHPLILGNHYAAAAYDNGFSGCLAHAGIYNVELTQAAILAQMHTSVDTHANVVAYWKCHSGRGSTSIVGSVGNATFNGTEGTNYKWAPWDGFDVWRRDTSGTAVIKDYSWRFEGV